LAPTRHAAAAAPSGPRDRSVAEKVGFGEASEIPAREREQGDEGAIRKPHACARSVLLEEQHAVFPGVEHGIETRRLRGERSDQTPLGRFVAHQDENRRPPGVLVAQADEARPFARPLPTI
jgi:hypothetical protein